jgi:hypothetical protein
MRKQHFVGMSVTACYIAPMSTDHLPLGALALETFAQPPAASSRGQALTVQLRRVRSAPGEEPMGGTLSLRAAAPVVAGTLHAGVVAADGLPLTITL